MLHKLFKIRRRGVGGPREGRGAGGGKGGGRVVAGAGGAGAGGILS